MRLSSVNLLHRSPRPCNTLTPDEGPFVLSKAILACSFGFVKSNPQFGIRYTVYGRRGGKAVDGDERRDTVHGRRNTGTEAGGRYTVYGTRGGKAVDGDEKQ